MRVDPLKNDWHNKYLSNNSTATKKRISDGYVNVGDAVGGEFSKFPEYALSSITLLAWSVTLTAASKRSASKSLSRHLSKLLLIKVHGHGTYAHSKPGHRSSAVTKAS